MHENCKPRKKNIFISFCRHKEIRFQFFDTAEKSRPDKVKNLLFFVVRRAFPLNCFVFGWPGLNVYGKIFSLKALV